VGQRRDGLGVGDPSQAYADALAAQVAFNGVLDTFFSVMDLVRSLPASARTADTRTWGPYADSKHAGNEFSVTVRRTAPTGYAWTVTSDPVAGGAALTVAEGTVTHTTSPTQVEGVAAVRLADFKRQLAVDPVFQPLDGIALTYRTEPSPRRVEMRLTVQQDAGTNLSPAYTSLEAPDGGGSLGFEVGGAASNHQEVTARWTADGAGRSEAVVVGGEHDLARRVECWDAQLKVTYLAEGWAGGQDAGAAASCPSLP
jgi:hypothetical protein